MGTGIFLCGYTGGLRGYSEDLWRGHPMIAYTRNTQPKETQNNMSWFGFLFGSGQSREQTHKEKIEMMGVQGGLTLTVSQANLNNAHAEFRRAEARQLDRSGRRFENEGDGNDGDDECDGSSASGRAGGVAPRRSGGGRSTGGGGAKPSAHVTSSCL